MYFEGKREYENHKLDVFVEVQKRTFCRNKTVQCNRIPKKCHTATSPSYAKRKDVSTSPLSYVLNNILEQSSSYDSSDTGSVTSSGMEAKKK